MTSPVFTEHHLQNPSRCTKQTTQLNLTPILSLKSPTSTWTFQDGSPNHIYNTQLTKPTCGTPYPAKIYHTQPQQPHHQMNHREKKHQEYMIWLNHPLKRTDSSTINTGQIFKTLMNIKITYGPISLLLIIPQFPNKKSSKKQHTSLFPQTK